MPHRAVPPGDRPLTDMQRSYIRVVVVWVLVLVSLYGLQSCFA